MVDGVFPQHSTQLNIHITKRIALVAEQQKWQSFLSQLRANPQGILSYKKERKTPPSSVNVAHVAVAEAKMNYDAVPDVCKRSVL